jgi:gliding motility-associated-like protein
MKPLFGLIIIVFISYAANGQDFYFSQLDNGRFKNYTYTFGKGFSPLVCNPEAQFFYKYYSINGPSNGKPIGLVSELKNIQNKFKAYNLQLYQDPNTCRIDTFNSFIKNPITALGDNISNISGVDFLGNAYFLGTGLPNNGLNGTWHLYLIPENELYPPKSVLKYPDYSEGCANKLLFYKDKILILDCYGELWICDKNYNIIEKRQMPLYAAGITIINKGCRENKFYAVCVDLQLAKRPTYEEFEKLVFDHKTIYLCEYDFEANKLTKIDSIQSNNNKYLGNRFGFFSSTEFLAGDQNCDCVLDLDRDNSSGVLPYDYDNKKVLCGVGELAVADSDVYVNSTEPIDSITIVLSGNKSRGAASLALINVVGISLTQTSDTTYLLRHTTSNRTDSLYRLALLALRYQVIDPSGVSASPSMTFIAHNSVRKSEPAKVTFKVGKQIKQGIDSTLTICTNYVNTSLSDVLQATEGGRWSPPLTSGGNTYDSQSDVWNRYQYIVNDPVCGNDTTELTIVRQTNRTLDLGQDRSICSGDTVFVGVNTLAGDVLTWSDGVNDPSRAFTKVGSYVAKIQSAAGCTLTGTIIIKQNYLQGAKTIGVCTGSSYAYKGKTYRAGQTFTDTLAQVASCDSILTFTMVAQQLNSDQRKIAICADDVYTYSDGTKYKPGDIVIDSKVGFGSACDTLVFYEIIGIDLPIPKITGNEVICFGASTDLSASNHKKYTWSNGATTQKVKVGGGSFEVVVVDTLNCNASALITITERPQWILPILNEISITSGQSYTLNIRDSSGRVKEVSITPIDNISYQSPNLNINGAKKDQLYRLIFKDDIGCLISQDLMVRIKREEEIFTPNTFNPNASDTRNRTWQATLGSSLTFTSLSIYDRWGNVLAINRNEPTWNGLASGTPAGAGVYVYKVLGTDADGREVQKVGTLTLMY